MRVEDEGYNAIGLMPGQFDSNGLYQGAIFGNDTNEDKHEFISGIHVSNPKENIPNYVDIPIIIYSDRVNYRELITGIKCDFAHSLISHGYFLDYLLLKKGSLYRLSCSQISEYYDILTSLTEEEKEQYRKKLLSIIAKNKELVESSRKKELALINRFFSSYK